LATDHNLTPNGPKPVASGKKSIYFVVALLVESAKVATISGAPPEKMLSNPAQTPHHPPQS